MSTVAHKHKKTTLIFLISLVWV